MIFMVDRFQNIFNDNAVMLIAERQEEVLR